MTEEPYPPEWLRVDDADNDPRLGDGLDVWQPTAGMRARAAELLQHYCARSPHTERVLLDVARDTSRDRDWLPLLVALCEQFAVTAVAAQGESLTVRRLAGDVAAARDDALNEAGAQSASIPGIGPQLDRAADGTDPRGVLVFECLPAELQNAEDSTQGADFDRATRGPGSWYREIPKRGDTIAARDDAQAVGVPRLRWLSWLAFLRDATPAERELLGHLGHDELPEPLYTRVSFPSPGVRNRRWPQLEIN